MKYAITILIALYCYGCQNPISEVVDNPIKPSLRNAAHEIYSYEGLYKLAVISSTGTIDITAYQDILSYEVSKDTLQSNDYILYNFGFDSVYLTYEVYKDTSLIRSVAIPVFDVFGEPIKACNNDCIEHECDGKCGEWVCSSCDFERFSCGYIKGCKCNHPLGCCTHSIRTCSSGKTINDYLGS